MLSALGVAASGMVLSAVPGTASRTGSGLIALYEFNDGSGATVSDTSGYGTPLDLTIADPSAVRWHDGVLSVGSETVIEAASSSSKISNAVTSSDEISLEAWVDPVDTAQIGPARIVSISQDPYTRNITLGQGAADDGTRAEARLRTTATDSNGMPALSTAAGTLHNRLTHLVYTRDSSGNARLYVDGSLASAATVGGSLSNWDSALPLLLANEDTEDRPWLGDLHLVAFYDRALSGSEVAANYAAGADPDGTVSNEGTGQRPFWTFTDVALSDRSAVHVNAASGDL
jgi:hypothetical protein